MLKAKFGNDEQEHLMIGLTAENVHRLLNGEPIVFTAEDVRGVENIKRFLIFFGKDDMDCYEQIKQFVPDIAKVEHGIAAQPDHITDIFKKN